MKTLPVLLMLLAAPLATMAAAQDALEEAKAHYAAAAYEEALSTLTRIDAAPAMNKVELEQYRAFCFIALGKMMEAERAVATLVAADPKYIPSPAVASPRVLQLVSEMRRKELPVVTRRLFDEGLAAFKDKQFVRAQRDFALLLQLLDDPALKGRPEDDDLRVLAEGFAALSAASLTGASAAPAPKPTPLVPPATPVQTTAAPAVEPPLAIQQDLPEWSPPDTVAASRDYLGSVKITIGADGKVKAAAIEKSTYPTYDARLLQAARTWVYKPALRDGQPAESEKVIAIQLRRRE